MTAMKPIIVQGDHTPGATAALRWAVLKAADTGAHVMVVRSFDVTARADLELEMNLDRARRDARYRTQSWVVEAVADLAVSVPIVVSTPDGSAADALVSAAQDALLVVLGVDGPGRPNAVGRLAAILESSGGCPVVLIDRDLEAVTA